MASALAAREDTRAGHPESAGLGRAGLLAVGGLGAIDAELVALCREWGPLRAGLSRIACSLVGDRAWERLGYARLSDYAAERLGLSARSVRSLAEVGAGLRQAPLLEEALVSGRLGWTKVRLLSRLPREENMGAWIDYAGQVTARDLSKTLRQVDLGSVEAGGADEARARSRLFEVRCTPEVRWKWTRARTAASRVAGRRLQVFEAAELVAAEVLSAIPVDDDEEGPCDEVGMTWGRDRPPADDGQPPRPPWRPGPRAEQGRRYMFSHARPRASGSPLEASPLGGSAAGSAPGASLTDGLSPALPGGSLPGGSCAVDSSLDGSSPGAASPAVWSRASTPRPGGSTPLPPHVGLESLLEGLDEADAFSLDDRFRRALAMERSLDARLSPLLALVWKRPVYRALGHPTCEAYARERLGMDPTRARALVRLEHTADLDPDFARAWRTGALSWVKARILAPLVRADPLGLFVGDWIAWAQRVTVRRLSDDVEHALAVAETDPPSFRRDGALPPDARHRETGASAGPAHDSSRPVPGLGAPDSNREIGAAGRDSHHDDDAGADGPGPDSSAPFATPRDQSQASASSSGSSAPSSGIREIGAAAMDSHDDGPVAAHGSGPGSPTASTPTNDSSRSSAPSSGIREIGAAAMDSVYRRHPEPLKSAPREVCWAMFVGPPDVVNLFRAVLRTVRRRIEQDTGRMPTSGEALDAMLDHVFSCWDAADPRVAARHRVFARDGWRCATPGCTSMQNLHDHHVRFRSAGGTDDAENRITLCAFHHLRGVHAGLLKCVGRAPDGLRWELGLRRGTAPLLVYRSGDVRVTPTASSPPFTPCRGRRSARPRP